MQRVEETFFKQDTITIAKLLLGMYLVYDKPGDKRVGKIIETEAYVSNDEANHAFRGLTKRNQVMFDEPGKWYIYKIYGLHYCVNVTTAPHGTGEAVLIRSLEPIVGIHAMKRVRQKEKIDELCSGPAKLTQSMAINAAFNGRNVTELPLLLCRGSKGGEDNEIVELPRIGIRKNVAPLLRFSLKQRDS